MGADYMKKTSQLNQINIAEDERFKRSEINNKHIQNGVRMIDPATTYIDPSVEIAAGVVLYPGCILEGECKIEEGAVIGPYTHLINTSIGKNAAIRHSVLQDTIIGANTTVGPFAHLRNKAIIGDGCRIGNFVEIKNANFGKGAKMAHLAYIGDADVGSGVNYGCGAVTANYDGKNKFRTNIEQGAFIGSNAVLKAPVTIGENAVVAAGSTVTHDVPANSLVIARARQEVKEGWVTPDN